MEPDGETPFVGPAAPVPLGCPTCGTTFVVVASETGTTWRCGRCDTPLHASGAAPASLDTLGGEVRYLYPCRPMAMLPESVGRRFGRYLLYEELGRGGMGVVYRAWDPDRAGHVALKVLIGGEHTAPEHVERFLREARSAAGLDHPNLVRVFDLGWVDERAYFTMDLIEGPSLHEVLAGRGALPLSEALRITAAIARGLATAHANGRVHRDVKPSNVLLEPDGTPVLTDFGLAADLHGGDARLTRTGQVMGTPAYMAPEQLVTGNRASAATDQYGLGAVLYELLTGDAPYPGADAMSVLQAILAGPPPPVRERGRVPRDVALVLETAMAREPERRYPSADAFADDLDRCRRGEPVAARPPGLGYRLLTGWRRHQRLAVLALTAVVAAALTTQGVVLVSGVLERRAAETRESSAHEAFATLRERVVGLRAEGRDDTALTVLERFAAREEIHGTVAATSARLEIARIHTEAGSEAATTAWAEAYGGARRSEDQDQALRGLAARFHASWDWDALHSVVHSLVTRNPASLNDPWVARWQAEARLSHRDTAAAAETVSAAGLPDAALLRGLVGATRVPALDGLLRRDPSGQLWVVDGSELRQVAATAGFPTLRRVTLPRPPTHPGEVFSLPGDPPAILTRHLLPDGGSEAVLYTLDARDVPSPVARWPEAVLLDATRGDLDRDGVDEIWVGVGPFGRHLVRIALGRGTPVVSRPVPSVDATASDVTGTALVDLDHDGRDELVLTVGAWSAYDVRVLTATPDGLVGTSRRKMGALGGLAPTNGGFWVSKSDRYPSRVVFPAGAELGDPPGVYALRLVDGALVTDRFLPSPRTGTRPGPTDVGRVFEADLDGDGVREVLFSVVAAGRRGLVVVPSGDPARSAWVLGGLEPQEVANVDDDAADEVVVRLDGTTQAWVLGLGADALPLVADRPGEREPVPTSLTDDPVRLRTWLRAEDLVGMGLADAAIDGFVALADETPDGPLATAARSRAARLSEDRGADERAATLYAQVAGQTGDPRAIDGAARNHLHGHRFAEALAAWSRFPAALTDSRPEIAALAEGVARTRTETWFFDGALPDAIEILDPAAVRLDPRARGLSVVAMADDGPLLRVPFRWEGDRLGLDVELELSRLEWSGGVRFVLRSQTGAGHEPSLGVEVGGWGGGQLLDRDVSCLGTFSDPVSRRVPVDGPAETVSLRLSVDVSATTGDQRCAITVATDDRVSTDQGLTVNRPLISAPEGGDWELVVEPTRHGTLDAPAVASVVVRSLSLTATGLALRPTSGPLVRWNRELASGEVPADAPRGTGVWRAVGLAEAGRTAEAVAQLRALRRSDPDVKRELIQGLRTDLPTFGPVVFETVGLGYYPLFRSAFQVPIFAHPDDPTLTSALTTGLPALESAARVSADDPVLRDALSVLLAARGRAWAALGQPAAARRDLVEATRIGEGSGGRVSPGSELAAAWVALAGLAASEGDPEDALEAIRRALEVSAAREITVDLVRASPELDPWVGTPAWRAVLEPR